MIADGTELPFCDQQFPVVFSNAVIQYVGMNGQPAFAAEVRRVSERYSVQTQNRWFPLEYRYRIPFLQFLPRRLLDWLAGNIFRARSQRGRWSSLHLLTARQLARLFPDADIYRERIFGLTKSLIAVRATSPGVQDDVGGGTDG
jgi:hypothetical protein